jgi:hypothetical protein
MSGALPAPEPAESTSTAWGNVNVADQPGATARGNVNVADQPGAQDNLEESEDNSSNGDNFEEFEDAW